jgi:transcriptional regulator with XRE-family HTH domain
MWAVPPLLVWVHSVGQRTQYQRKVGASIRSYRTQAGFSIEKLAEAADLHPVYLGCVERGEENISLASLWRLANALKVRVRDLVAEV